MIKGGCKVGNELVFHYWFDTWLGKGHIDLLLGISEDLKREKKVLRIYRELD